MYDVTGIGYFTALDFAGRNARVILACRNMDKAVAACSTIREETGNKNIVAKHLEVSSLRSVRRFVAEVMREETRLDVLVNNAGVLGEILWCTCERERNVLFNDALNTFYLRLYGVRHMVKDHSDTEKGNPLPSHRLLLSINSKGYFYMHHPTDRITHTTAFVTPVVEHWLEREIAQWVHPMKDRSDDPSHHEQTLYL